MRINIGDAHQFIGHCLIPLDSWVFLKMEYLEIVIIKHLGTTVISGQLVVLICL